MGYMAIYDLAKASSFRNRLIPAIVQAGGFVLQEASDGRVSYYNKRRDLARRVLRDPEAAASEFVWPVLSNVTIASAGVDAPDGDIAYQVNEVWSTVAGVTSDDEMAPEEPVVPE